MTWSVPANVIREYYRRIDMNDTEWVVGLFAADAIYERADSTYRGAKQMRQFFCIDRQIRGVHSLEHLWCVKENIVVVLGSFDGFGAEGDARSVRFGDVWWFNAERYVKRRQTFLALGHGYVAR